MPTTCGRQTSRANLARIQTLLFLDGTPLHRRLGIQHHILRTTRRFQETPYLPIGLDYPLSNTSLDLLQKCENYGKDIRSVYPLVSLLVPGDNVFGRRVVDGAGCLRWARVQGFARWVELVRRRRIWEAPEA